jgi:hypothetical protein
LRPRTFAGVIGRHHAPSALFFRKTPSALAILDLLIGQTLIKIGEAKQSALCPGLLHLVCLGARFLSATAPVLRIRLVGHCDNGSGTDKVVTTMKKSDGRR